MMKLNREGTDPNVQMGDTQGEITDGDVREGMDPTLSTMADQSEIDEGDLTDNDVRGMTWR
jgi:hypothetical protein